MAGIGSIGGTSIGGVPHQSTEYHSGLLFQLITPEKLFFKGDAEMVTIPGTEGEFGVLTGHAPFVSTIRSGVITIELSAKETRRVAVLGGLAEVVPDHCTVLTETAEDISSLTAADAQARLQGARRNLDEAITDAEKSAASLRLALAEVISASF